jgi:hypothetical protein
LILLNRSAASSLTCGGGSMPFCTFKADLFFFALIISKDMK